ncbi:AfsR/SARP family transcriptional regulator [Actinospica robiniae]|uniref:AfsR/SARP family transcriptional regulator n=1 Tax=Actinospica robiniae TaxID=304901 RepID=UPI00041BBC1F|nr:BTAD domain-containing putative transcriptional regulator [Actinospica robiniae]
MRNATGATGGTADGEGVPARRTEFRVLGPFEAAHAGMPVDVGGPRNLTVLAMLLLEEGSVVPVDRLITAVWDEDPPRTARAQIQICVSAIRRLLRESGGRDPISTRRPGYLLELDTDWLDLDAFESGVAAGRRLREAGDRAGAAAAYRSALSLWRGPALSGLESPVLRGAVLHLDETRMAATEECLETELHAEPRQESIGELIRLVRDHPLREHLQALLISALYRTGRQAEALDAYRKARIFIVDELGIEPGPELQRLHRAILNGEALPEPAAPRRAEPPAPVPVAVRLPSEPPIPRLLSAAVPDFTGRELITARILASADPRRAQTGAQTAVSVDIVFGPGGSGKTALAIEVAHRLAPDYPDGQLMARLQVGDRPVDAAEVLGRFLRVLGVEGHNLPEGLDQRAEMYRNLLGSRRILVVLDDAVSEEQLSWLLPGNPQCAVIVTSRRRLAGLPAAGRHEVGALEPGGSTALLARILGDERVAAEPEPVATLCALCDGLPLALRIAAARLAARPHWSVASLVDRLLDDSRRLDELHHGEMGLRASISGTYESLSAGARRLLRLMALPEAPSLASWAVAPLLDVDVYDGEDLLEELVEAYLLHTEQLPVGEPTRYRFHDIMRSFARERLAAEERPDEQAAALERLAGTMLYLSRAAHSREYCGEYLLPQGRARRRALPQQLTDRLLKDPLAWFEHERVALAATIRQCAANALVDHASELAISSVALYEARCYFEDWRETHEAVLQAACRTGNERGEAAMRYSLGSLHLFVQRNEQAMRQFSLADEIYLRNGDEYGSALVQRNVATLERRGGNVQAATEHWESSLRVFQVAGDRIAEAYCLIHLAQVQIESGNAEQARGLLRRAEELCQRTGNHRVGAQVEKQLGDLALHSGELDRAAQCYDKVIAMTRESGDVVGRCYGVIGLARVDLRRARYLEAAQALADAARQAAIVGDRAVGYRAVIALAEAELGLEHHDSAGGHAEKAAALAREIGAPLLSVQAMAMKARVLEACGRIREAEAELRTAARLLSGSDAGPAAALSAEIGRRLEALAAAGS